MSQTRQYIYPDLDNTITYNLGFDLSDVTQITLDFDGLVIDSATIGTALIDWASGGTSGALVLKLGDQDIPAGEYEVKLTWIDADNPNGVLWTDLLPITVVEELALIATAGAANANLYSTFDEAKEYFRKRLHSTTWDNASDVDRKAALIWATELLDALVEWDGTIYTDTQALRWPRYGVVDPDGISVLETTIPTFLKNATAELAMFLIEKDLIKDPTHG